MEGSGDTTRDPLKRKRNEEPKDPPSVHQKKKDPPSECFDAFGDYDMAEVDMAEVAKQICKLPPFIQHFKEIPEETSFRPNQIPLTDEEKSCWMQFKDFDKSITMPKTLSIKTVKDSPRIDASQPIVPVLGKFIADAYNEVCSKAGVSNRLEQVEVIEAKYLRMMVFYLNFITFKAEEDGNISCYEAKVITGRDEGEKTLVMLRRNPSGKKKAKHGAHLVDMEPKHMDMKDKEKGKEADFSNGLPLQVDGENGKVDTGLYPRGCGAGYNYFDKAYKHFPF